jgi:hypothetical protein
LWKFKDKGAGFELQGSKMGKSLKKLFLRDFIKGNSDLFVLGFIA